MFHFSADHDDCSTGKKVKKELKAAPLFCRTTTTTTTTAKELTASNLHLSLYQLLTKAAFVERHSYTQRAIQSPFTCFASTIFIDTRKSLLLSIFRLWFGEGNVSPNQSADVEKAANKSNRPTLSRTGCRLSREPLRGFTKESDFASLSRETLVDGEQVLARRTSFCMIIDTADTAANR